jgi:uncharacterized RDD family membrane protein YckC
VRWTGSWLSGPGAARDGDEADEPRWPGERFGLPQHGPGSVASLGRRALALLIDIVLAALVAALFTAPELPRNWSLAAWFAITIVAVSFFGFTPGMAALGIRVVRMDGASMVGPIRAIPRTIMVALIIPAVITNRDGRGLHDRAIGTIVVRIR